MDATHLAQFNQMEGLYVAENVSRRRPQRAPWNISSASFSAPAPADSFSSAFFPFTEPSYEIDIRAEALGGKWLELPGCGMVDPAVFEQICPKRGDRAFDPERVTGFAFGFGLDRLAMNLTKIPDIRMLVENDLRFLQQFQS